MKRNACLGLTLALAAALTGCLETTEPQPRTQVWVAHLAAGAGTYAVGIDGRAWIQAIGALTYTSQAVAVGPHSYTFQHDTDGTSLSADAEAADITLLALMNSRAPELQAYGLDRVTDEQRVVVVNADSAASDLTVLLIRDDPDTQAPDTTAATVAPGASETLTTLEPADYEVLVHGGDVATAESQLTLPLTRGAHGFLVVFPATAASERYDVIVF